MASDTDTKKNSDNEKPRWFRYKIPQAELPEIDHIFDLYWGGPERRITGLTLRIISVNALALITLIFGLLYLGQYQSNIIETKLENFETEVQIVSQALSDGGLNGDNEFLMDNTQNLLKRFSITLQQDIIIFEPNGSEVIDTTTLLSNEAYQWSGTKNKENEWSSIRVLKNMAAFFVNLLPDTKSLPSYPVAQHGNLEDHPDAKEALNGAISLSVWQNDEKVITLTAAAPITRYGKIVGVVLLKRNGRDIEESVTNVWLDVLRIFSATLLITTLLSIYLSGVIANPLKRLAKAAESVRTGRSKGSDIPDLSHRNDEIGELSIALKAMTNALWDRMDSIESFAADVSHELKNPLTSLRSAIETMDRVSKKSDKEKLMSIIQHDLERMDRLITDISSASRLDAELSREAFSKIDLHELLERIISFYKNPMTLAENKNTGMDKKEVWTQNNVQIALDLSTKRKLVTMGLEERLEQVFRNVIDNALSFSPEKSMVKITIYQKKKHIHIDITDEGPGVPENKLETIFSRFYSERPESEGYGKHSGLGLSICKQIIDAHDGEIYAQNTTDDKGKITGAKFSIILKAA